MVDSSIIETNRRARRAKTDRLDGVKLLTMLMRYWAGERGLWSVVQVPNVEGKDARRLHRELESLKKERTRDRNRIRDFGCRAGRRRTWRTEIRRRSVCPRPSPRPRQCPCGQGRVGSPRSRSRSSWGTRARRWHDQPSGRGPRDPEPANRRPSGRRRSRGGLLFGGFSHGVAPSCDAAVSVRPRRTGCPARESQYRCARNSPGSAPPPYWRWNGARGQRPCGTPLSGSVQYERSACWSWQGEFVLARNLKWVKGV